MATSNGLEPSTSSVTGWRANRLHHEAMWHLPNKKYYTRNAKNVNNFFAKIKNIFQV